MIGMFGGENGVSYAEILCDEGIRATDRYEGYEIIVDVSGDEMKAREALVVARLAELPVSEVRQGSAGWELVFSK